MVGVRSLSIGLSIALVVCTGAIVGTLSITTGQKTTADAREAGDRGVAATLASGDKDIRQMAARYLKSSVRGMVTEVEAVFGRAVTALKTMESYALAGSIDDVTANGTTTYVDTIIRTAMMQTMTANYPNVGGIQFQMRHGKGAMFMLQFDVTQAYDSSGNPPWAVVETQAPGTNVFGLDDKWVSLGAADKRGRAKDAGAPCFFNLGLQRLPDLAGDRFGRCPIESSRIFSNTFSNDIMMDNIMKPASPLALVQNASTPTFTPIYPYYAWLQMSIDLAVDYPGYRDPLAVRNHERIGFFSVSVTMDHVSHVFANTPVPQGTIMYAVDKEPWTGKVGQLVATNYGQTSVELIVSNAGIPVKTLTPIRAVNHTFDANTTELSPIAHHARYIFAAFPTHYEDAAAATDDVDRFLEWDLESRDATEPAAVNTYWYTVLHMEYANLNWYISMLVPRSSIMDAIDASVAAVQAQREQDREDTDEFEKRSLLITVVVTVVVACLLCCLSAVVTNKILSPLMGLERDMACVAVMNVEAVDLGGEMSALSEVRGMEESFRTMVKNLVEYKQYMPQSVLVTDTEDEEHSQGSAMSGGRSRLSCGTDGHVLSGSTVGYSVQSGSPTRVSTQKPAASAFACATDLRRKPITIVAYNIRSFLTVAASLRDADLQDMYSNFLSTLLAAMKQYRGVCDTFAGDHFMVAHNAFVNQATHKTAALQEALHIRRRAMDIRVGAQTGALSVSFAACSGEARVGQMGCAGMKKVTINSSVVPWAAQLETYNKVRGYMGVADESVATDAASSIVLRRTDVGISSKRIGTARRRVQEQQADGAFFDTPRPISLFETLAEQDVQEDEWMYQMESAQSAVCPHVRWNVMMEELIAGQLDVAGKSFEAIDKEYVSNLEHQRVAAMIAAGRCDPVNFDRAEAYAFVTGKGLGLQKADSLSPADVKL